MKRWLSFVFFIVALVASSRASAALVKDGTDFSVDVSAARICWVYPHELRIDADCEGLTPDDVEADLDRDFKSRAFAMGLVHMERLGEEVRLAVVTITKVTVFGAVAADNDGAKDYARGAEEELRNDLPIGARLRPSDVHMVKPGAHPLLRGTFAIDGIPETSDKKLTEQQIHHAVFTEDGGYVVVWVGRHEDKTRLETLADAAAPSIHVARPAGTRKQLEKKFEAVFTLVFAAISGIVIVVVLVFVTRKRQQPAYGYGYYGTPAPPPAHPPPYSAWHPSHAQPQQPPSGHWSARPPSVAPPSAQPASNPPAPRQAPQQDASYAPPKDWWDQPR